MKSRDAVGKRIVAIEQCRYVNDHTCRMTNAVTAIVLENGTRLIPTVDETDSDYTVDLLVVKKEKEVTA
jgi:hypothetical protein